MPRFKYLALAALLASSTLFSGCFDQGVTPMDSSGNGNTQSVMAASVTQGTWQLAAFPGRKVAFTSITSSNSGWALDTEVVPGGYGLRRFQNGTSKIVPGGLVDLDIAQNTILWGTNNFGWLFRNTNPSDTDGGTWVRMITPAPVRRVAAGANGAAFILTDNLVSGGNWIYKYSGSGTNLSSWGRISGGLIELDVDDNGDVWGVNKEGKVLRLSPGNSNGTWKLMSGVDNAINVAVGKGKVFILTGSDAPGGKALKQWSGLSFTGISGGLLDIQVDVSGRLWGYNNEKKIFKYIQ